MVHHTMESEKGIALMVFSSFTSVNEDGDALLSG